MWKPAAIPTSSGCNRRFAGSEATGKARAPLVFWLTAVNHLLQTGQSISRTHVLESRSLFSMRWLMIGLLVSLGALLFAAAGVARHIWLRRSKRARKPVASVSQPNDPNLDPADETDQ